MYKSIKSIKQKLYKSNNFVRIYHSENGVYGYKPKKIIPYYVNQHHIQTRIKFSNFYRFVEAYRQYGHKQAKINPLIKKETLLKIPELDPKNYGLNLKDVVSYGGILNTRNYEGTVEEAINILDKVYTSHMGIEFQYLEKTEEREWFAQRVEQSINDEISDETKKSISIEMLKSQVFGNFLAMKFVGVKRYGPEGSESMMAFFHEFFNLCASNNSINNIIMSMPHRGRLNLLIGMLQFPPEKLFRKFRGFSEFTDDIKAIGDISSHFIANTDLDINNKKLHVEMLYNPSHLEAVNPVSMGKTRATMNLLKDGDYSTNLDSRWSDKVINLQVHGDAAYTGQGVNQECLSLSQVPHFEIGGTIHLIINNQIGFTTPPSRGRSSLYCSDLAKFISAPVIHVNGDYPEDVVKATRIAFEYQRKFRKDVFIDLNCFRRWGHNELDDPTFTNPIIYKIINNRKSVPDIYRQQLENMNVFKKNECDEILSKYNKFLSDSLKKSDNYISKSNYFNNNWAKFQQAGHNITLWNTGVELPLLKYIINKSVHIKDDLDVHPTLLKHFIQDRLKKLKNNEKLDWATAETAAFGSLLYEGYNVRLSGQDVSRGTFSHRHAMFVDQSSGEMHIPLNSLADDQVGKIELANSILSEEAVLGYEYGMSITLPYTLVIWEAQFGDFFNGAQIIIDTFLTSGETKWMENNGLVMLLPHGYDGAGAEHSSCRLERFLQLSDSKENYSDGDDVNIQIVYPTTPAQYFHLLRRQMVRNFRKPLIVVAPKILLRHECAKSNLNEMGPNSYFKNVISDEIDRNNVDKMLLVSGKHYYALKQQREIIGAYNTAIIRVESLCPFPVIDLNQQINKYPKVKNFIWCQEEPQNMGAWSFVKTRFQNLCGQQLKYCGREALSAPAVGIGKLHEKQSLDIITKPFFIK